MRSGFTVLAVAAAVMAADARLTPSLSQSFFQKLFGLGGPEAATSVASRPVPSLKSFGRVSPYGGAVSRSVPEETYQPHSSNGNYRTLCVRTCDGYYWPISSSTSQSRLHQDARRCESSCDTEARLFYLPRGSSDIANMTDLNGRAYGRLPSAFAYRTGLMAGCSCRPMPWNHSELQRHEGYRVVAALERERLAAAKPATAEPDIKKPLQDAPGKSEETGTAQPSASATVAETAFDPPMVADIPLEWMPGATQRLKSSPKPDDKPVTVAEANVPPPAVETANEMIETSANVSAEEVAALQPTQPDPTPAEALTDDAEAHLTAVATAAEPTQPVTETDSEIVAFATVAPWQPAIATRMTAPDAAVAAVQKVAAATGSIGQLPMSTTTDHTDQAAAATAAEPLVSVALLSPERPSSIGRTKAGTKKAARPAVSNRVKRQKATAVASWMGTGGGKYTWPGDAPQRRVR